MVIYVVAMESLVTNVQHQIGGDKVCVGEAKVQFKVFDWYPVAQCYAMTWATLAQQLNNNSYKHVPSYYAVLNTGTSLIGSAIALLEVQAKNLIKNPVIYKRINQLFKGRTQRGYPEFHFIAIETIEPCACTVYTWGTLWK